MFDELKKYKKEGHFFFKGDKSLTSVCDTPAGVFGVFLVYKLAQGHVDLVYIGYGGTLIPQNNSIAVAGELRKTIVSGIQFGQKRNITWARKIKAEQIDALDVYWHVTVDDDNSDAPAFVRALLLQKYLEIYGALPPWNEEF